MLNKMLCCRAVRKNKVMRNEDANGEAYNILQLLR